MWLGKPVIAINTATYWHALRQTESWTKFRASGACSKSFEIPFNGRRDRVAEIRQSSSTAAMHTPLPKWVRNVGFCFPRHVRCCPERRHSLAPRHLTKRATNDRFPMSARGPLFPEAEVSFVDQVT